MNQQSHTRILAVVPVCFLLLSTGIDAHADRSHKTYPRQRLDAEWLVRQVLARNPGIAALRQKWHAARAYSRRAGALADPTLSYSLAPDTIDVPGSSRGEKYMFSQTIPWPGKRRLKRQSAESEAEAVAHNLADLKLKLAAAARMGFADWYYIHQALSINAADQKRWQEYQRIAIKKYGLGQVSKQDAIKAEVRLTMLKHQAIVLRRKQKLVRIYINQLLNNMPDAPLPRPVRLRLPRHKPDLRRLRALGRQHPRLQALQAKLKASELKVKLARRNYYPDLKLMAGYNSLWNDESKRTTIGIGINIPLGRSKRRAEIDQRKAQTTELYWKIQQRRNSVLADIQRQYEKLLESRHTLRLFRTSLLPLSREHLHAATADYQAGKGSFLELVDAQNKLSRTRLQYAQALAQYSKHLAHLLQKSGVLQLDSIKPGSNHESQ